MSLSFSHFLIYSWNKFLMFCSLIVFLLLHWVKVPITGKYFVRNGENYKSLGGLKCVWFSMGNTTIKSDCCMSLTLLGRLVRHKLATEISNSEEIWFQKTLIVFVFWCNCTKSSPWGVHFFPSSVLPPNLDPLKGKWWTDFKEI